MASILSIEANGRYVCAEMALRSPRRSSSVETRVHGQEKLRRRPIAHDSAQHPRTEAD